MPWGPNQCDKIRDFDEAMAKMIEANNIVFSVHIPLPNKEMSPWFQFMLVILQFDIAFKMYNQIGESAEFNWGGGSVVTSLVHVQVWFQDGCRFNPPLFRYMVKPCVYLSVIVWLRFVRLVLFSCEE